MQPLPLSANNPHRITKSLETVSAAGIWTFCSVGMMVFNKMAVKAFPLACSLVMVQMIATVLAMLILARSTLRFGSSRDVLRWAAVAPFFAGVLLSSMYALEKAPMSLVIVFRGLAPLFSICAEVFYPEPMQVTPATWLCLGGIMLGVLLYAKDLDIAAFSAVGWVLLNNFFVVGDRLLQRLMLGSDQWPVDISKSGCTLLNNSLGLLPLGVAGLIAKEYSQLPAVLGSLDAIGMFWISMTCCVGVGIAYSGIWLQSLINATTFLVLATSTKFFVIMIEVFVMHQKSLTARQFLGATVTIIAGVAYGKVREAVDRDRKNGEQQKLLPKETGVESPGDSKAV